MLGAKNVVTFYDGQFTGGIPSVKHLGFHQ
jgi:hypothetical protein